MGPLVASAPSVVALPALEPDNPGIGTASTSSAPLLRAVAAPALGGGAGGTGGAGGGGGGGGGGAGGMDRGGIKGVPVGHPFWPEGVWLSRRPGVGCAGGGEANCGGVGWGTISDFASSSVL